MWTLISINLVVFIGFLFLAWKKPGLALILLLPVAAGMSFSGLFDIGGRIPDEVIIIHLLAIILLPITICIIHWSPSSGNLESPWYKTVTSAILTLFKYVLILAVFCVVFQFFGPVLFILLLVATYQFSQARKFGLAIDIISTIGTSMRQSLPLPMALATAAYGQKKKDARIFNNIAHWLTQGVTLSEAIQRGYPKCPANILASITTAEKMNQLPRAVESLQVDLSEKLSDNKSKERINPVYPLVVLVFVFMIMMGLFMFIIPTFAEVLSDMSNGLASLPAATQLLLNFASWFTGRNGLNALMIFAVVLSIAYMALHIRFRRRRPEKPRFLSRVGDRIKWASPVLHWFEKTFGNLYLAQTLRVGLAAGYPVNTILRNVLGLDVNICYQNRIRKWLDEIESGDDIAQSARVCGLDKPLAWAFDDKINKGNAPQILKGLEEIYRNKYNYRKSVLCSASEPVMILCLGLIVGYVIYAMFMGYFGILTVTLQYTIPQ